MGTNKKDKKHTDIRQIDLDFHQISFDELRKRLNTSLENGLEPNIANELYIKNGKNKIKTYKKNMVFSLLKYFFSG